MIFSRLTRCSSLSISLLQVHNFKQTRSFSLLGTIFGIGEFEGPRNASLATKTNNSDALQLAILGYVSMNSHPKHMLKGVLERNISDNTPFVMGHAVVGASQILHPLHHEDSLTARKHLDIALQELGSNPHKYITDHIPIEKWHVMALEAMIQGTYLKASVIYETILLHQPRDLFALRCCYDLYILLGDRRNTLSTVGRQLPFWSSNDTGYSHLLAMQADAWCGMGRIDIAENLAEKALFMNVHDRWAFHTLMQVWDARGNPNHAASAANERKDSFENGGPIERHLYYLWSLFLLELGRYNRIDGFIEDHIFRYKPDISAMDRAPNTEDLPSFRGLCDTTQLYWRLRFAGQENHDLLERLHAAWSVFASSSAQSNMKSDPWTLLLQHSIIGGLETGKTQELKYSNDVDLLLLEKDMGVKPVQFSHNVSASENTDTLKLAATGFTAYKEERFDSAVESLIEARNKIHLLGRLPHDHVLIDLLLIDSASRSKNLELARLLLHEHVSVRPQSAQIWSTAARVYQALGDSTAVAEARSMSYVLGLGQGGTGT